MVVSFPDQERRTLNAVISGHRRLSRTVAADARRRARVEPAFEPARYVPTSATIPFGPRPSLRAATAGAVSVS